MSRALRGALRRRALLLALLALTLVVVAGTVGVTGFAQAAGTSPTLVVPLLVLGLVAVPSVGRELAVARRDEVALARLRGADVPQVVGRLAGEPLAALLLGTAAGVPLGLLLARASAAAWLDRAAAFVPTPGTVVACLAVVVVGLVGVLVGTAGVVCEPLADQVGTARRTRAAGAGTLFARVLVVVAAVVAAYRSRVVGDGAVDADLVTLAAPALVGLAVGEAAVLGLRLAARAAVPLTARRGTAAFLAVRRLGRAADSAAAVRLLVAAAVVAGLALTGAGAVDGWAEETARLRAGAPLVVEYDGSAAAALRTTRDLDPAGDWLAAAAVVDGGEGAERRAFVDARRLARVSGEHLDPTGAARVAGLARRLPAGRRAVLVEGDRLEVDAVSRGAEPGSLLLSVDYVADADYTETAVLRLDVAPDGTVRGGAAALPGCARGCVATRLLLGPAPGRPAPRVSVRALRVGGTDLLAAGWDPLDPQAALAPDGERRVVTWAGGIGTTGLLGDDVALVPAAAGSVLPVLAAPGASPGATSDPSVGRAPGRAEGEVGTVSGPGGDRRPARVVATLPALPLVEGEGVLADLASAVAASPPGVADSRVLVLARADTPAPVLRALAAEGGGSVRTLDDVAAQVRDATGAAQARAYAVVAVLAAVVAVVAVAAPARGRRAARRQEVAALRLLGVPRPTLRAAGRLDVLGQAVAVAVAGAVGCLAAVALLLPHLPLVRVPRTAVAFDPAADPGALALALLGAVAVCVLVGAGARRVGERHTAPAVLREEVQG
ncbi:FtsX-like permease family protein [Nocardioides perillae]|uniref:ABC3 transporter permease C-terminal domain-containing protein n=1 Tax=Nocardioides perillae TaxID=1119534 RepID=A0A7Y9RSI7_9ACTN|nr:FtsX-like permease family protein [Nocardioides perillae]NYG54093.1 hypothetical protein [Nocardioides perillae]